MRKRGLGRGLSDLLSSEAMSQSRAVVEVPLDEIEPNALQPRTSMNEDALEDLTSSIEMHGVLQPIIVRRSNSGYQIVAGERRWRASQRAGLATIPCLVQEADDLLALELALIENLQRDDLNAIEAARGYRMLMLEYGLTQEDVSQRVGKSRSAVANSLRILDLPGEIQECIREGSLTEGHGRALLPLLSRPEDLSLLVEAILDGGLSVRETERLVREALDPTLAEEEPASADAEKPAKAPTRQDFARDPHIAAAEQRLRSALAAKVAIRPAAKRGGVIHIRYYDNSDLDRLLEVLENDQPETI